MTFWFIYTLVLRVYSQSVILAGTSKIYLTMVMLERWIQHSLETRTETVRNYFSRSSSLIRIDNRITCKSSKSVKYNSQTAHNALVQTPRFQIWLVEGHHPFKSNSDWLTNQVHVLLSVDSSISTNIWNFGEISTGLRAYINRWFGTYRF